MFGVLLPFMQQGSTRYVNRTSPQPQIRLQIIIFRSSEGFITFGINILHSLHRLGVLN
jgi:hypothetical protein